MCGPAGGSRAGRVEDSGGLGGRNRAVRSRSMPGRQGVGRPKWICSSGPGGIAARTESRNGPAASFAGRGRGGAGRSHRAVPYLRRQLRSLGRHALAAALELAVLATALPVQAQTPVQLVSNIGQQATTTPEYFNRFDAAQAFTTGTDTNGYKLTSVDIDLNVARRITWLCLQRRGLVRHRDRSTGNQFGYAHEPALHNRKYDLHVHRVRQRHRSQCLHDVSGCGGCHDRRYWHFQYRQHEIEPRGHR